jgi:hypothetical protein
MDFILKDIIKLPRSDVDQLFKWGTGPIIECKPKTALEPFIKIATGTRCIIVFMMHGALGYI